MMVMGFGFSSACTLDELAALLDAAAARAGASAERLAVPARRARLCVPVAAGLGLAAMRALAAARDVELTFVEDAALASVQAACVTRSARVARETGLASVAEACALAAAGPGAVLAVPRLASHRATCAAARSAA